MRDAAASQFFRSWNRWRLVALIPILVASIWNTGQQYLLSVSLLDSISYGHWRDRLIIRMNSGGEGSAIADSLIAGLVMTGTTVLISLITAGIVLRLAAPADHNRSDTSLFYYAILFACLMPPAASSFHIIFGFTLGTLLAYTIFGGEGKSFLNPALTGVALTQVSFPFALTDDPVWNGVNGYAGTTIFGDFHTRGSAALTWLDLDWWSAFTGSMQGMIGTTSILAILAGTVILVLHQLISWRLVVAQLIGVGVAATLFNLIGGGMMSMPWYGHVLLGSFAFSAVFFGADPCSSCCTNTGRWIQGLLTGALVVFIRVMHPSHPDSVIPVMLLMSMMSPLIDHVVTWSNIQRRRAAGYRGSTDQ